MFPVDGSVHLCVQLMARSDALAEATPFLADLVALDLAEADLLLQLDGLFTAIVSSYVMRNIISG